MLIGWVGKSTKRGNMRASIRANLYLSVIGVIRTFGKIPPQIHAKQYPLYAKVDGAWRFALFALYLCQI